MNRLLLIFLLLLIATSFLMSPVDADEPPEFINPGEGYSYIGNIQPRHAREIEVSNWSIGAETMDRDFTIYRHWREHLGPLGVKKARIQSGWAKTEKSPGVYDWDWLDEIILDMVDQGVEPWVCLCYGNPIYPDGGGTGLGGGIPTSDEALEAWDAFVAAMVDRYIDQVDEWEVWNEPGLRGANPVETYADLLIRTAETIREIQPDGQVIAFGMAGVKNEWVASVLDYLQQRDKLDLVDEISYHPYSYNPDDSYDKVESLRELVETYSDEITLRQGENGAPSQRGSYGALSDHDWSERSQAKWALRRMLGDLGRDIPSSYFAICDMEYTSRRNYKGVLAINDDRTVHHRKEAYRAIQHLTSIFDNRVALQGEAHSDWDSGDVLFLYKVNSDNPLLTFWFASDAPSDSIEEWSHFGLKLLDIHFDSPVWIDLLSGRVYEMDSTIWDAESDGTVLRHIPFYDSPCVIVDRDVLEELGVEIVH